MLQTVLGPPELEHRASRESLWAVLGVQCEGPQGRICRYLNKLVLCLWLRMGSRLRQPKT